MLVYLWLRINKIDDVYNMLVYIYCLNYKLLIVDI